MKTVREFIEKLNDDKAFAEEVSTKVKERIEAGETDYKAIWIPVAAEYGYELTAEELDRLSDEAAASMSDEELGKVAGGSTPICVTATVLFTVSVVSLSAKTVLEK